MKVLFTTWAWPSHLYAMAPLAWALRSAGHEVRIASQPALMPTVKDLGLPAIPVGSDVDTAAMVREYLLPPDQTAPPARRGAGKPGGVPRALRMLLAHAESMLPDLVTVARRWQPDLVVYDSTNLAGPIAAAAVGVPGIRHLFGVDLMRPTLDFTQELLAPLAARHDVRLPRLADAVTVDPTPPSFQAVPAQPLLRMRYVPFNGPGLAPPDPVRTDRPRVAVTWGHTIAKVDPLRFPVAAIARRLAADGVDVTVVASHSQRPLLGVLPAGVTVLVDTPLHLVLPEVDALVHHGGAGTALTALSHGVPALVVPQLPDHAGCAARVAATGAGRILSAEQAGTERLTKETHDILTGSAEREAADRLRRELVELPPPSALVPELTALA
ncbi:nucleotide disphospho-sugar-binding domain-containing protein [Kutzneria sp. NPDC052558]|uniref:nucleotide disphospho-sugar-binding domain-containing protein n=1 Tax=Kutzneria sp. NPDC052558 TaxID=3364121 RepID=UPI0037C61B56